jgi:hypothetical protein
MVVAYAKAMPALQAQEQLDRIEAATAPNLTQDGFRRVTRRLMERLGVKKPKPIRPTREQLAAIGVTTVSLTGEEWAAGGRQAKEGT